MFLLDAVYHTFKVRSAAFPRNKGQMYGKFKIKLSWLPFVLAILFIFCTFEQVEGKSLTKLQLWASLAISGVRSHIRADVL